MWNSILASTATTTATAATTTTTTAGMTAAVAAAITATVWYNHPHNNNNNNNNNTNTTWLEGEKQQSIHTPIPIIEVDFMDKLARKPYLKTPTHTTRSQRSSSRRPRGVPETLRILTIDLPQVRQYFGQDDSSCQLAYDKVYPDGLAPPKQILDHHDNNNDIEESSTTTQSTQNDKKKKKQDNMVLVEQKAWVKAMMKCQQQQQQQQQDHNHNNNNNNNNNVGIEILEASFQDLNPYNVRKIRQVGSYHYDPGKYYYTNNLPTTIKGADEESEQQQQQQQANHSSDTNTNSNNEVHHAPWNQYAWMEELTFRIHGWVPFGEPMLPSSRWSRTIHGTVFQRQVPSQRHWYEVVLPPFLQRDPAGMDGGDNKQNNNNSSCWASHKPHAVIANGAAIQRVPSGLRLLQQTCRDANVPLFVVYDPRVWGSNTHDTLEQALRDIRKVVKQNIIHTAMQQQSGFARGRMIGRIEKQAQQHLLPLLGATTSSSTSTSTSTASSKRHRRLQQQQSPEEEQEKPWDTLNAAALETKLMERGIISLAKNNNKNKKKKDEDEDDDGSSRPRRRYYTPAMVELARQCVKDQQQQRGGGDNIDADDRQK